MTSDYAADVLRVAGARNLKSQDFALIPRITERQLEITVEEARALIKLVTALFVESCIAAGHTERSIRAITTKFRDAGRRSAPWRPASSRVPGRPQDGNDGNRISRWLLPPDHKFFANEIDATLVEIKYYLQSFSMRNGPVCSLDITQCFTPWLLEHSVVSDAYLDPIQMVPIDFRDFIDNPRALQSGHLVPLDRGGRHVPSNTFLMLFRSNQLQGNLTVAELLKVMREIVEKHDAAANLGDQTEREIREE